MALGIGHPEGLADDNISIIIIIVTSNFIFENMSTVPRASPLNLPFPSPTHPTFPLLLLSAAKQQTDKHNSQAAAPLPPPKTIVATYRTLILKVIRVYDVKRVSSTHV